MAKKKSPTPLPFSPKSYLKKGTARKLPIHECWILEQWREVKKFSVIVCRRHVNGHVTFANFLVDLLCTGVKDVMYAVNIPEHEYTGVLDRYTELEMNMVECKYKLAHNIVYGALEFAEEFHIEPHTDFRYAKMILEEDNDDIEWVEIPLGENEKPILLLHPDDSRNSYYLGQMEKHAGPGNYTVVDGDGFDYGASYEDDDELSFEFWEKDDWEDFLVNADIGGLTIFDDLPFYIFNKMYLRN